MPAPVTAAVTVESGVNAPPRDVWVALSDPATVDAALPDGASLSVAADEERSRRSLARLLAAAPERRESWRAADGERYDATLDAAVRSVEASFDGAVTVTECEYPRLAVECEGRADEAAVTAEVAVTVAEGAACHVTLTARADVSGVLAACGRRPVETAVARRANAFFETLGARLAAVGGPESERAVKDPDWRDGR